VKFDSREQNNLSATAFLQTSHGTTDLRLISAAGGPKSFDNGSAEFTISTIWGKLITGLPRADFYSGRAAQQARIAGV
jgi:hypothetical protein